MHTWVKCEICQSCRLFIVLVGLFFIGGVLVARRHPKFDDALQQALMGYQPVAYIGVDASTLIVHDCNLQCSPYRSQPTDDLSSQLDALEIVHSIGINTVKLRLFHAPSISHINHSFGHLDSVIQSAQRIHAQDMKFHLVFHFNDSYAYASEQRNEWNDLVKDQKKLHTAVYRYTLQTMSALHDHHVLPHIISIGHETQNGFLLDSNYPYLHRCNHTISSAKLCDQMEQTWMHFAGLLRSIITAIRTVASDALIMLKSSDVDVESIDFVFMQQLRHRYGVQFDLIGISMVDRMHAFECTVDEVGTMRQFIMDTSHIFGAHDTDWMMTEFGSEHGQCLPMLMEIAHSAISPHFRGFEWLDAFTFTPQMAHKVGYQGYQYSSLFDENGVLLPGLHEESEEIVGTGKSVKDPTLTRFKYRRLTYAVLSVLSVVAIGYSFCFWHKSRQQQQQRFIGILKKW